MQRGDRYGTLQRRENQLFPCEMVHQLADLSKERCIIPKTEHVFICRVGNNQQHYIALEVTGLTLVLLHAGIGTHRSAMTKVACKMTSSASSGFVITAVASTPPSKDTPDARHFSVEKQKNKTK
jgi:hypothetical protein